MGWNGCKWKQRERTLNLQQSSDQNKLFETVLGRNIKVLCRRVTSSSERETQRHKEISGACQLTFSGDGSLKTTLASFLIILDTPII